MVRPSARNGATADIDAVRAERTCRTLVAKALLATDARLVNLSRFRSSEGTVASYAWIAHPPALWRRAQALAHAVLPGFDVGAVRFAADVNPHVRAVHLDGELVAAPFAEVAAGTTDPRVIAIAGSVLGLRHTLSAPVHVDGEVVGSLAFHGLRVLTARELTFATAFAWAAALALENERLVAAQGRALADSRPLTSRQWQVAALIARGLTDREIASALSISRRTSSTHVSHILERLGCANRAQIAAWAAGRALTNTYSS